MTSPSGVQPVKLMVTLSWGPGCAVPFAFDSTFQASPLAVLVASAGASATSGGAAGGDRARAPQRLDRLRRDHRAIDSAARKVVKARVAAGRKGIPAAYHENPPRSELDIAGSGRLAGGLERPPPFSGAAPAAGADQ